MNGNDKYTVGIDFGTLSGRAVLVRVSDGREIASAVADYQHGVIDAVLPTTGERLPADWALQDPDDYLDVLAAVIPAVLRQAGVDRRDVIGVGVDFTCCTILPVLADGTPLCFTSDFKGNRNAYVKLWKHHAAQPYADRLNAVARERGESWLGAFGGKISSEWMFPKIWQIADEAPDVYAAAAYIIEAGDWINWMLTGKQTRSYLFAAYKAEYTAEHGYPSEDFFAALDPRLTHVVSEKLDAPVIGAAALAGRVNAAAAEKYGLAEGTAVAAAAPDAHVAAPAVGLTHVGDMYGVFGTSNCYFALGENYRDVPGICGCVRDGLMPELYGYEAGLCCVGDHFSWLADNFTPAAYREQAGREAISPLKLLIRKAAEKKPGQTGLVALDWWNGNRNVLVDANLSGLIVGMNLLTRPEDIMRALIEATAFGTRVIIDTFAAYGVKVNNFIAAGGIARKDPFTMQLYSDVLHLPIRIAGSTQIPALGSAIYAATAAGGDAGGYDSVCDASSHMMNLSDTVYYPDPEAGQVYDKLYAEYLALHDYFGRGGNDVMKRLRAIAASARE